MGFFSKLFGGNEKTHNPEEKQIGGINDYSGIDYYNSLGFERYGFTPEEKRVICDFYEFSQSDDGKDIMVKPISKEQFDTMEWFAAEYLPEVCLLWGEDSGNDYAGVYISGPLRGKVMMRPHDNPNYAPLFRSISSFVERAKNDEIDDLGIPDFYFGEDWCDYPAKFLPEDEIEQNDQLAKQFLDSLSGIDDPDEYYQTALKAIHLMPKEHLDLLIPLMKSGNMYVEQDICTYFAFHDYRAAIPALQDVAENGSIYIKDNAKRLLSRWLND